MFEPAPEPHDVPLSLPPRILPIQRLAALFEVTLCSGFPSQLFVIGVLTALGMHFRTPAGDLSPAFVFTLSLVDTVLVVGLVVFFLRAHRESPRQVLIGPHRPWREAALGIILMPATFMLVVLVMFAILTFAPSLHNVPRNPLEDMLKNRQDAIIFAFVVMIAGGYARNCSADSSCTASINTWAAGWSASSSSARCSAWVTSIRATMPRSPRLCSAQCGAGSTSFAAASSRRWSVTRRSTSRNS